MPIDIRTIVLIMGISHLMQVLVFFHQYKTVKDIDGPKWWLLWSGVEFGAFVMVLLRGIPSFKPAAIIFTDPAVVLGTLFIYVGVVKFFGKKVNVKFLAAYFVSFFLLHNFFYFVFDLIVVRTIFLDISLAAVGFYTAFTIYKNHYESIRPSALFAVILFVVHGTIFTYRTAALITGTPITEVLDPTIFNMSQYFDGLIIGLLWTFSFILLLNQKLHADISEAKDHFEQIFHLTPNAVLISRISDGTFVNCNEHITTISGYSKEDIIGKNSETLGLWYDVNEKQKVLEITREKGYCSNFEATFRKKTGELLAGLLFTRVISLNGTPHLISVVQDISRRKKAEDDLKLKNDELQKANSEKDKFFSIIAHDLKSPFSGLIGYSEILSNEYDSLSEAEKRDFISSISELSHNSFKLLENLLEWTRIQTGQMAFIPEDFNLLAELHSTFMLLKHTANNKDIKFQYEIDNLLFVRADKNMLSTILRNLVSNSIKFTNRGGEIKLTALAAENSKVIEITDNGIGMDDSTMKKLFNISSNISRRGTDNEEGTGLGLLLCKEMIDKHNGAITVKSELGRGTTFTVTLPN